MFSAMEEIESGNAPGHSRFQTKLLKQCSRSVTKLLLQLTFGDDD